MKEIIGNLWEEPADYRVITTNGFIKNNGSAVMGRGVALQAKNRYADVEVLLGRQIRANGLRVTIILPLNLIAFPVKYNWWEPADLILIQKSLRELNILARSLRPEVLVMPMPGVGNGQRKEEEVLPLMLEEGLIDTITLVRLS